MDRVGHPQVAGTGTTPYPPVPAGATPAWPGPAPSSGHYPTLGQYATDPSPAAYRPAPRYGTSPAAPPSHHHEPHHEPAGPEWLHDTAPGPQRRPLPLTTLFALALIFALGWTLLTPTAAAHANTGPMPAPLPGTPGIGLGSAPGVPGLPAGSTGTTLGDNLAQSSYTLSMIDPASQTMTMGVLGSQLTDDYTTTLDLAQSNFSAIDAAEMARMARMLEDARRAAQSRGGATLKPGAVPAPYDALIMDAISRYCPTLSPGILAAQIEAESRFNPRAVSPVGAKGIAQFMDGTWTAYGVDGNGDGRKDVWDPEDAIPAAARYDCAVRDMVRKVGGDPDANMLAGYNAGPGAVLKHNGVPPYDETQKYVTKILNRAGELTVYTDSGAGAAGDASGCPVSAPAGTLRDSARQYSINRICADSVAQARSPEAARAIKFALRNLGAPYSQPNRMGSFSFDCSSFVMRAYDAAGANVIASGWAPNTYAIEGMSWARRISFSDRRPGDLVYPFPGHIAMSLAHGLKVHTNRPGDVSHVNNMYSSAYLTVAIDTSRV